MNYRKIYNNLINNAKKEKRVKLLKDDKNYVYYENHHITPKCLNGDDHIDNLVLLTAREHYIAHKLLTYIYPKENRLVFAFHRMTYDKHNGRNLTSRDYDYERRLFSKRTSGKNSPTYGKSSKDFWIEKYGVEQANIMWDKWLENNIRGENNPMFGKQHSEESILRNISNQPYLGKPLPVWLRKKISEGTKGEKNPFYGKTHSEETRIKISESRKKKYKCKYCGYESNKSVITSYHNEKCKSK